MCRKKLPSLGGRGKGRGETKKPIKRIYETRHQRVTMRFLFVVQGEGAAGGAEGEPPVRRPRGRPRRVLPTAGPGQAESATGYRRRGADDA